MERWDKECLSITPPQMFCLLDCFPSIFQTEVSPLVCLREEGNVFLLGRHLDLRPGWGSDIGSHAAFRLINSSLWLQNNEVAHYKRGTNAALCGKRSNPVCNYNQLPFTRTLMHTGDFRDSRFSFNVFRCESLSLNSRGSSVRLWIDIN